MGLWSATAYSSTNQIIASVGEPSLIFSAAPQNFVLNGPGISYVTFYSNVEGFAGSYLSIDDLTLSGGTSTALADTYTCQTLDAPGAASTQVWQLNNQGQLVAGTDIGAFLYDSASGLWTAAPAPAGFDPAAISFLGINNFGQIAGVAFNSSNAEVGFTMSAPPPSGTYTLYPPFASPIAPTYTNTEFRTLSDNGLVTGQNYPAPYGALLESLGFIFNPASSAISIFQPGYTAFIPKLSDGSASTLTIMGAMNKSGLFVGSAQSGTHAKEAFLYNPNSLSSYSWSLGGSFVNSAARGINNLDPNSSTSCSGASCVRIVGFAGASDGSGSGYYVDFDPVGGLLQTPQVVDCAPAIPSTAFVGFQGVNDRNIITGQWSDASGVSHGLIAYPNVVQPAAQLSGSFVFNVRVAANVPAFLDPPIAVGYSYAIGANDPGGPKFGSVTLPIGVGGDLYTLLVQNQAFTLPAGQKFDFTKNGFAHGVGSFKVVGISPSAALSPTNGTAFVTEATFLTSGQFTGTMTPMSAEDEIANLLRAVDGAPARLERDLEHASEAYQASNVTRACSDLSQFVSDVQASRGPRLSANAANYLTAQANAVKGAVGCP